LKETVSLTFEAVGKLIVSGSPRLTQEFSAGYGAPKHDYSLLASLLSRDDSQES